jgi:hypothetical protein
LKKIILFLLINTSVFAQTARVKGVILDEKNEPVVGVQISDGVHTTQTNADGFYILKIAANQKVTVTFSHVSYGKKTQSFELKSNQDLEFNPVMNNKNELVEVIIKNNRNRMLGITNIPPAIISRISSANPGIESVIKTLPGVNSNNELSSAYSVRGGNYDENLVYVNEIEVYRPFLVRSGQQEGLSFTNTDMVSKVDFSAGGFQAKFGDKLSSVLDITYRTPTKFGAAVDLNLLGGGMAIDAVTKNQKWNFLTGIRYRDNSLLVKSQEVKTNFKPTFADIQTQINFVASNKLLFSFLGNFAQNKYNYQPLSRQTNFGTINNPIALQVYYDGQEKDKYTTVFGAVKTVYKHNEKNIYKAIASGYHTQEQEYYDIDAAYSLGEVDTNLGSETFGNVVYSRAIGSQLNHARNDLDALILNAEIKGFHEWKRNQLEWGAKVTKEDIRDRLIEWEVIDSAGFSINPPKIQPRNDQPYNPYIGPLVPYNSVRATNYAKINRLSGYLQWSRKDTIGGAQIWYNAGFRAHNWQVETGNIIGKNQIIFSPRFQVALKPNWERDMVFRISGGMYAQPPFYRELRDANGVVQPDVKAQKSIHFVFSNDYSFMLGDKQFKLVSELYYKSLTDVNPYTLDNVRIRYAANNNATAYAQGIDFRLNGEFVKGTESWFSFGYLKTEENIDNKGFIARPTDQLLKFGILFQDYMPNLKNVKVYLNLVYNTGLPGGSPSYADPYQYQTRLRDYRRADVGFSYIFTENNKDRPDGHWLKKFQDLSAGFEIFNMFNNQNSITNTWVRDVYTKAQYGIPNYMTTRVFNLKFSMKF